MARRQKYIYVVMQQGGTTCEWYATSYNTLTEARDHKSSCAQAAYHTSEPHKIKLDASEGEWLSLLQDLVCECVGIA